MPPAWLQILRCPITHSPLRELLPDEIQSTNRLIARGELSDFSGNRVLQELEKGLISCNRRFVYRVENNIFFLLTNRAIVMQDDEGKRGPGREWASEKQRVQDFYDRFGWRKTETGTFQDTRQFVDARPVVQDYYRRANLRLARHLKPAGKYFLDAASGPIPAAEFLENSKNYDFWICVDLSIVALQEAQAKLGERGLYLLADIANLPLPDNSMDAVLSLHTIYHVPEPEQKTAFQEIYRVLKPQASAVVVYSWGGQAVPMKVLRAMKSLFLKRPRRLLQILKPAAGRNFSVNQEPPLYFHAHDYSWFNRDNLNFPFQILGYRAMNVSMLRAFIHPRFLGRQLLNLIYFLEDRFPRLAGRLGEYPMIVFQKCAKDCGDPTSPVPEKT